MRYLYRLSGFVAVRELNERFFSLIEGGFVLKFRFRESKNLSKPRVVNLEFYSE